MIDLILLFLVAFSAAGFFWIGSRVGWKSVVMMWELAKSGTSVAVLVYVGFKLWKMVDFARLGESLEKDFDVQVEEAARFFWAQLFVVADGVRLVNGWWQQTQ